MKVKVMKWTAGIWMSVFGVYPFLGEPAHDDTLNPVTWLDWAAHFGGFVLLCDLLWKAWGEDIKDAWSIIKVAWAISPRTYDETPLEDREDFR